MNGYWQNSTGGKGALPAAVLVVHDEPNTRELAVTALRAAFLDVTGFDDPMAALNAIEDDTRIRVLITRVTFGPGKLNGVALARMVRVKRPGTKIVFVARAEYASHTEGLGKFLPMPLRARQESTARSARLPGRIV
jgi:DNA-binding NtrC family response regulator